MIRVHCDQCGDDITDDTASDDCWDNHRTHNDNCPWWDPGGTDLCDCPVYCARHCPTCQETT
jgi:hypothetical protein